MIVADFTGHDRNIYDSSIEPNSETIPTGLHSIDRNVRISLAPLQNRRPEISGGDWAMMSNRQPADSTLASGARLTDQPVGFRDNVAGISDKLSAGNSHGNPGL